MAGIIVPFLDKRSFEFGYLTSGSQDVVLHPGIDVSNFYRVRAVIRVHQLTATTGNFTFKFQHTAPSDQDPQEFTLTASDFMTSSSINSSVTAPTIITVSQTDPYSNLKVVLRATQGSSGNTLYGEFSAFLILREY